MSQYKTILSCPCGMITGDCLVEIENGEIINAEDIVGSENMLKWLCEKCVDLIENIPEGDE